MIQNTIRRVSPPERHRFLPQLNREENDESADGNTSIQRSRGQVVVTSPPVVTVSPQQERKDESKEETVGVEVRESRGHVRGRSQ